MRLNIVFIKKWGWNENIWKSLFTTYNENVGNILKLKWIKLPYVDCLETGSKWSIYSSGI